MVMTPAPTHNSAVSLASMAAWLSSTGISHHNLLPHIPSICLSAVNSNPHPGCSIIPKLQFPAAVPSRGPASLSALMYGRGKDCLSLIPFRLSQITCLTLSLKCFSSDLDNCPDVEIGPLLQFPLLLRAGPVLLTLLFFPLVPSSYRVFMVLYILGRN